MPRVGMSARLPRSSADPWGAQPDGAACETVRADAEGLLRSLRNGDLEAIVLAGDEVPAPLPDELRVAACLPRTDPWAVWLSDTAPDRVDLPPGATVLTASDALRAQLLHVHPALEVQVVVQGEVEVEGGAVDVLRLCAERGAAGAVWPRDRLPEDTPPPRATYTVSEVTPDAGSGIRVVVVRADAPTPEPAVEDLAARAEWRAERAFVGVLNDALGDALDDALGAQGGAAVAALGRAGGATVTLVGVVATADGSRLLRLSAEGPIDNPESVGAALARTILRAGGAAILAACAGSDDPTDITGEERP